MPFLREQLGAQAGELLRILALLVAFARCALSFSFFVVEAKGMSVEEWICGVVGRPSSVLLLPPFNVFILRLYVDQFTVDMGRQWID